MSTKLAKTEVAHHNDTTALLVFEKEFRAETKHPGRPIHRHLFKLCTGRRADPLSVSCLPKAMLESPPLPPLLTPFAPARKEAEEGLSRRPGVVSTYIETGIGHACGVQLRQHTFKRRYSWEVREKTAMLPVRDPWIQLITPCRKRGSFLAQPSCGGSSVQFRNYSV